MCPLLTAIDSLIWNRIELTFIKRHGSISTEFTRTKVAAARNSPRLSLEREILQELRRAKIFLSQQLFKSYLRSIDSRFFTSLCVFWIIYWWQIINKNKSVLVFFFVFVYKIVLSYFVFLTGRINFERYIIYSLSSLYIIVFVMNQVIQVHYIKYQGHTVLYKVTLAICWLAITSTIASLMP